MAILNPRTLFNFLIGASPSVRSGSYSAFKDCLQARLDDYKAFIADWAKSLRPSFNGTTSPALDHITAIYDDLSNDLRGLNDLLCVQQAIRDTGVNAKATATDLFNDVQDCLEETFAFEGLEMSVSLESIIDYLDTRDAELAANIGAIEARRDDLQSRVSILQDTTLISGLVSAPDVSYIAAISRSNKIDYVPGELVTYEIATNKPTSTIAIDVPRDDVEPPRFDSVPDTAITRLGPGHFQLQVQFPPDYLGERFRVKHQLASSSGDYSLFFARFDKERNPAGPVPRFRLRECPPVN